MDKATFIENAPRYHAAAIIHFLNSQKGSVTSDMIVNEFHYFDTDLLESIHRLKHGPLLRIAIENLLKDGIIVYDHDPFGPPIITRSEIFEMASSIPWYGSDVYKKIDRVGRGWLNSALLGLLSAESELKIRDEDYNNSSSEWSPIQINKEAPEFKELLTSLDDTVEKIRSDNGYAATYPEERDYVLGGLGALQKQLNDKETVTIPFLRKYADDQLISAGKRFGKSFVGLLIDVCKEKFKAWLLSRSIPWPFSW